MLLVALRLIASFLVRAGRATSGLVRALCSQRPARTGFGDAAKCMTFCFATSPGILANNMRNNASVHMPFTLYPTLTCTPVRPIRAIYSPTAHVPDPGLERAVMVSSAACLRWGRAGGGLATGTFWSAAGAAAAATAGGSRGLTSQVTLSSLRDNPGARKKKIRVGRGIGSGRGKTGGRGHKGQLSRAGNNGRLGFEGGQTPITRRYPKRGFNNPHAYLSELQPLNIDRLVRYVMAGRLDTSKTITMKHLRDCGCVDKKIDKGIKLLGKNAGRVNLDKAIHIQVSDVSAKAREVIEKAGGSVQVSYFNALGLRALL